MREIKFRYWDKEEKKYYYSDGYAYFYEFWEVNLSADEESEQYTGLKDSKGVEIYEGDILADQGEAYGPVEMGPDGVWIGDLRYCDNVWIAPIKPDRKNPDGKYCTVITVLDVIGNIHENPELLDNI